MPNWFDDISFSKSLTDTLRAQLYGLEPLMPPRKKPAKWDSMPSGWRSLNPDVTLFECLFKAGDFPFVAEAMQDADGFPKGSVVMFTGWWKKEPEPEPMGRYTTIRQNGREIVVPNPAYDRWAVYGRYNVYLDDGPTTSFLAPQRPEAGVDPGKQVWRFVSRG